MYAPCEHQQRPAFFAATGPVWQALIHAGSAAANIIMAGDFNTSMTVHDVSPAQGQNPATSTKLHGATDLQQLMAAADLVDAWREQHLQFIHTLATHKAAGAAQA